MSGRTYLSIGDVLALLRQEFPDVTISKIRFLESQGLVDPERTPSGYRKFYEHDVERLRWVLRQQREHFLPLKVIKGRLEQEDAPGEDGNGHEAGPVDAAGYDEPVLVVQAARGSGAADAGAAARATERGARTPDVGRRPPTPASVPAATGAPAPSGSGRATVTATPGAPAAATAGARTAAPAPGSGPGDGTARRRPAPGPAPSPTPPGAGTARAGRAAEADGTAARRGPGTEPAPAPGSGGGRGPDLGVPTLPGNAMTADELAEASGLDVAGVEQLESYGLVCGRVVGGVRYFEEDALTVAKLAAGFARYGVEARHLRLHKHAAEREAGFIEQIVLPLLKQRNPEARQRAHDTVTELSALGQRLREALLRSSLRDLLGG